MEPVEQQLTYEPAPQAVELAVARAMPAPVLAEAHTEVHTEAHTGAVTPWDLVTEPDETPSHLLNNIIVEAYRMGVSQISIESERDDDAAHVWFCVGEAMLDYMQVPAAYRAALAAQIRLLCRLDGGDAHLAQIGRINFDRVGAETIELRVAIIPCGDGFEDIRMRLLRTPFAQLGYA
jgi:type II secretory ATPase GspE/PulE/Tfp pilus assembly ATPase PilB-like protein